MSSPLSMYMLFLVMLGTSLPIITAAAAAAAAATAETTASGGKEVACDAVEKYTTEWFLRHTKPAHRTRRFSRRPQQLFYSRDMSDAARALASSSSTQDKEKLITIWDVWPCHLYWHEAVPRNPLRCIHNDAAQRQRFFGNMSLAFARRARGPGATVLHGYEHFHDPPADGIWATVEYPELTRPGGPVDRLRKVRGAVDWPGTDMSMRKGKGKKGKDGEMGAVEEATAMVPHTLLAKIRQEWLASRGGIEWLRCVREEMASWSEVFWKRVDYDKSLRPGELKRGLSDYWDNPDDAEEYDGDDDDDEDDDAWYGEDESCLSREALEFFDNAVDW